MPAMRGAPTEAVSSGIGERVTVGTPAFSISRCTSPTDQQQVVQKGARSTRSTSSLLIRRIIAGTLWERRLPGRSVYPMKE